MTAGAILVPSIIPLRSPMVGQVKNCIDTDTPIDMRSETPNTRVYYTTNGLKPSPFESFSPEAKATILFDQPITLPPGKKTIKALAVTDSDNRVSNIVTKVFEVETSNSYNDIRNSYSHKINENQEFMSHLPSNNEARLRAKRAVHSAVMGRAVWPETDERRIQFNNSLPNTKFNSLTQEMTPVPTMAVSESSQLMRLQRETDYLKCPYCLAPRPTSDPFSKFCNQCGSPVTPLIQNNPSKKPPSNLMDQVGKCPNCNSIVPFNTNKCIICEEFLRNEASNFYPSNLHHPSNTLHQTPSLCPSCGTANPPHSKLCFVCTSILPASTSALLASMNNMIINNNSNNNTNNNANNLVKVCEKCGRTNNSNARFCDWCRSKPIQCSNCFTTNHSHSKHCSNCGSILPPPTQHPFHGNPSQMSPATPFKPVMTSEMSTQTVGLYYPSATKVKMLENLLIAKSKESSKGWLDQRGVVLSALSPGRGYWRKQIDHICGHLKAHATNDINFRSLVAQPRMGKLLQATVNEDGYELSLTLNFALRSSDSIVEVRNVNGEVTTKNDQNFGDLFEENEDDDDEEDDDYEDDASVNKKDFLLNDRPRSLVRQRQTTRQSVNRDGEKDEASVVVSDLNKALIKEVGKFGKGRPSKVQELIDQGADARGCSNRNGLTLLHMASTCNHHQAIPVLVQAGINVNVADNNGNTSLHEAVKLNDPETEKVVDILLGCGANPNKKNKFSQSAFDIASKLGHQNLTDKMAVFVGQISLNKMAKAKKLVTKNDL